MNLSSETGKTKRRARWILSGFLILAGAVIWVLTPLTVENVFSDQEKAYFEFIKNRGSSPEISDLEKADSFSYFVRPSHSTWPKGAKIFYGKVPGAVHAVDLVVFGRNRSDSVGVIGRYTFAVDKDLKPIRKYLQTVGNAIDLPEGRDPSRYGFKASNLAHADYEKLCESVREGRDLSYWQGLLSAKTNVTGTGDSFDSRQYAEIERVFYGTSSTVRNRLGKLALSK